MAAIDDVLVGKQVGSGDGHSANLVERHYGDPPGQTALQDKHHSVASLDAEGQQITGCLVRQPLVFAIFQVLYLSVVVGPKDGFLLWLFLGIGVDDVIAEVEMLRNDKLEMLHEVFVARKLHLIQKSLNHFSVGWIICFHAANMMIFNDFCNSLAKKRQ